MCVRIITSPYICLIGMEKSNKPETYKDNNNFNHTENKKSMVKKIIYILRVMTTLRIQPTFRLAAAVIMLLLVYLAAKIMHAS